MLFSLFRFFFSSSSFTSSFSERREKKIPLFIYCIARSLCEDARPKPREKKRRRKKKRVLTDIQKKNIFKIWKESAPDDDACFFSQFCHQYYYEQ
tara:strand:- start:38 stop:322 length:285 start_codon:yes stop_codon:yes gene_type:complete